jgi:hypothetical protein
LLVDCLILGRLGGCGQRLFLLKSSPFDPGHGSADLVSLADQGALATVSGLDVQSLH